MGADFVSEGVDKDLVGTTGSVDGTKSVVMDHVDVSVPTSDSTVIKILIALRSVELFVLQILHRFMLMLIEVFIVY